MVLTSHPGAPTSGDPDAAAPVVPQGQAWPAAKVFEAVAERTDVPHPVCMPCTRAIHAALEDEAVRIERECEMYQQALVSFTRVAGDTMQHRHDCTAQQLGFGLHVVRPLSVPRVLVDFLQDRISRDASSDPQAEVTLSKQLQALQVEEEAQLREEERLVAEHRRLVAQAEQLTVTRGAGWPSTQHAHACFVRVAWSQPWPSFLRRQLCETSSSKRSGSWSTSTRRGTPLAHTRRSGRSCMRRCVTRGVSWKCWSEPMRTGTSSISGQRGRSGPSAGSGISEAPGTATNGCEIAVSCSLRGGMARGRDLLKCFDKQVGEDDGGAGSMGGDQRSVGEGQGQRRGQGLSLHHRMKTGVASPPALHHGAPSCTKLEALCITPCTAARACTCAHRLHLQGQCVLLLYSMAHQCRVTFSGYSLVPCGSFSKIRDQRNQVYVLHGPPKV